MKVDRIWGGEGAGPAGDIESMDWITERIAIGNIDDAVNPERMKAEGVTAILSLYRLPTLSSDCGLVQKKIAFHDGPGNSAEVLGNVLSTLDNLLTHHKVLVHCMEGVSRSPFVVACHLALENNLSLSDALRLVEEKRPIGIAPDFFTLWDEYLAWRQAQADIPPVTSTHDS